jgi:hypothetical protein
MSNSSFQTDDTDDNKSHDDLLQQYRTSLDPTDGGIELAYSYLNVYGREDLQDYDERCEIARDIQVEIQKYLYDYYIEDVVYNISVDDDVCFLYINGPTDIDIHVKKIESIVNNMFFDRTETTFTRFYKYLRDFIFF